MQNTRSESVNLCIVLQRENWLEVASTRLCFLEASNVSQVPVMRVSTASEATFVLVDSLFSFRFCPIKSQASPNFRFAGASEVGVGDDNTELLTSSEEGRSFNICLEFVIYLVTLSRVKVMVFCSHILR